MKEAKELIPLLKNIIGAAWLDETQENGCQVIFEKVAAKSSER